MAVTLETVNASTHWLKIANALDVARDLLESYKKNNGLNVPAYELESFIGTLNFLHSMVYDYFYDESHVLHDAISLEDEYNNENYPF